MNERQFIVLKRNEGRTFKEIADTLNILQSKSYSSHYIGKLYRDEIETGRGEESEKPRIEIEIKNMKDEFDEFLEMVGEQYRTINWAVRAIKGDRHCSCTCGTSFLRDIITKEGSQHFAYRKCMICERQIKWLSQDQVEYPKL
tara:strand:+ start:42 stop:470 length:429 start_codon:yes stop_codon:yes gene_type:complete